MLTLKLMPRFSETDTLGHISNTTYPVWLEDCRTGLFNLVHPTGTTHDWPLIIARLEQDFVNQCYLNQEVTVTTWVEKIGTKSFTLGQKIEQNGNTIVNARAIMVWFDYKSNSTVAMPEEIRAKLSTLMLPAEQ